MVSEELAKMIYNKTGIDVSGFNCSLSAYEIRKIFKDHGDEQKENLRGQRAVTEKDLLNIPRVIQDADEISESPKQYNGKPVINFIKELNGRFTVSAVVSNKRLDLFVQTAFIGIKKGDLSTPIDEQASINTPEASSGTISTDSIHQNGDSVNPDAKKSKADADFEKVTSKEMLKTTDEEEFKKHLLDELLRSFDEKQEASKRAEGATQTKESAVETAENISSKDDQVTKDGSQKAESVVDNTEGDLKQNRIVPENEETVKRTFIAFGISSSKPFVKNRKKRDRLFLETISWMRFFKRSAIYIFQRCKGE